MNTSVKHSFSFPNSKIWKRLPAGIVLAAVLFTVLPRTFHVACYAAAAQSGRYEWEDAPSPEEYDEVIAIVHTNDVHGFIEHEPYVKGFSDQLKAGENTTWCLLSAEVTSIPAAMLRRTDMTEN